MKTIDITRSLVATGDRTWVAHMGNPDTSSDGVRLLVSERGGYKITVDGVKEAEASRPVAALLEYADAVESLLPVLDAEEQTVFQEAANQARADVAAAHRDTKAAVADGPIFDREAHLWAGFPIGTIEQQRNRILITELGNADEPLPQKEIVIGTYRVVSTINPDPKPCGFSWSEDILAEARALGASEDEARQVMRTCMEITQSALPIGVRIDREHFVYTPFAGETVGAFRRRLMGELSWARLQAVLRRVQISEVLDTMVRGDRIVRG